MECSDVHPLVLDFIRSGLRDPDVEIVASAMIEFPSGKQVNGWPAQILAVRLDDHGNLVDGIWAHGGTGGTEALNDVGRLYTDLGDGMSADSKSELWRRFVHAVSYEEIATVLGCLDG